MLLFGNDALNATLSGSYNTAVGDLSGVDDGLSNSAAFGQNAIAHASNQVIIGASTVTSIGVLQAGLI